MVNLLNCNSQLAREMCLSVSVVGKFNESLELLLLKISTCLLQVGYVQSLVCCHLTLKLMCQPLSVTLKN